MFFARAANHAEIDSVGDALHVHLIRGGAFLLHQINTAGQPQRYICRLCLSGCLTGCQDLDNTENRHDGFHGHVASAIARAFNSLRITLPVTVIGSASTKVISLG